MPEYIPQWAYDRVWPGRTRGCPKCGTQFISKFDRGHCPQCYHSFLASEVYGLPPEVTLAKATAYTAEESQKLLSSLSGCMELVEGFPVPPAPDRLPELDREDWQFHRRWLQEGVAQGGILYAWRQEQPRARFGGYVVVKEGHVLAVMRTEVLLWD